MCNAVLFNFSKCVYMWVVPGSAHSQTYPIYQTNFLHPTMASKLFSTKCIPGQSYRLNLCLLASNMIINKSQGGTFRFSEWAVIFSWDYNVLPSRALQICVCVCLNASLPPSIVLMLKQLLLNKLLPFLSCLSSRHICVSSFFICIHIFTST